MDDNVFDILDNTIDDKMEINIDALGELVYITSKQKNLENYIKKVSFIYGFHPNATMTYACIEKKISIYLKSVNFYLQQIGSSNFKNDIKEGYQNIYKKMFLAQMLLHEEEHAIQYKKVKEGTNDIETRLLKLNYHVPSIIDSKNKITKLLVKHGIVFDKELSKDIKLRIILKRKYGLASLLEKQANNNSIEEIIAYLSNDKDNYSDMINLFEEIKIISLLLGYDFTEEIASPTERYIKDFKQTNFNKGNIHFTDEFNTLLEAAKNDTLDKRLQLGLSITEEEANKVKKKIM